MRVLDFHTRKNNADTIIVEWDGQIVALDRDRLEAAIGGGSHIWIEKGDMLPSTFKGVQPQQVEVPDTVLARFKKRSRDEHRKPGAGVNQRKP